MKHALDLQAALIALARSLAHPSVEISGVDGHLFFDSERPSELSEVLRAFMAAAPSVLDAGRELKRRRYVPGGPTMWSLPDRKTFRAGVSIVLTEAERGELRLGAWYRRQRGSEHRGRGLKVEAPAGR